MVNFLRKHCIKDYENVNNNLVRAAHGKLAALFGIISNLFLFIVKIIVGILTLNISVFADSINNLSDMASSLIILFGFHFAKMPADKEHPFGHERIEYISGLIVSLVIILSGGIMAYTSLLSVIHYEYEAPDEKITIISLCIMAVSVFLKFYQGFFNRKIAKIIKSDALKATSLDSFNDAIATTLVFGVMLFNLIIYKNNSSLSFSLEGILGFLISIYIIISGISMLKDEMNPLIGYENTFDNKDQIIKDIQSHEGILGVHDIMCHSYGPTKIYMTVHAEMSSDSSITESHDLADHIEREIKDKYGVELTIHVDPVDLHNEELEKIKIKINEFLKKYPEISYHDLRLTHGDGDTVIEIDLIFPFDENKDKDTILDELNNYLLDNGISYRTYINTDLK